MAIDARRDRHKLLQEKNVSVWLKKTTPGSSFALDANLKKNIGFIKKCKTIFGAEGEAQILRDIEQLKLEKYVAELSPAVMEGILLCKSSADIVSGINIISALHYRFSEKFTPHLVVLLLKSLAPQSAEYLASLTPEQKEKEDKSKTFRQKVVLRVLCEMFLSGLLWRIDEFADGISDVQRHVGLTYGESALPKSSKSIIEALKSPGYCIVYGALHCLLENDHDQHRNHQAYLSIIKNFAKDFALSKGDSYEESAASIKLDIENIQVVRPDHCERIKSLVISYFDSSISQLTKMNKTLKNMEKQNEERLFNKGQLSDTVVERYKKWSSIYEKFSEQVNQSAEYLGLTVPDMSDDSLDNKVDINFGQSIPGDNKGNSLSGKPWDDDEERKFYEAFPPIESLVPPVMFELDKKKLKANDGDSKSPKDDDLPKDFDNEEDIESIDLSEDPANSDKPILPLQSYELEKEEKSLLEYQEFLDKRNNFTSLDNEDNEASPNSSTTGEKSNGHADDTDASKKNFPAEESINMGSASLRLDLLITRLPFMINTEMVDQAAIEFCFINVKFARAKIIRALADVSRNKMGLLPYYSRFIAILHPFIPEIGNTLVKQLISEFQWLLKKKVKGLVDSRIKNIRYIGELVKFKVVSSYTAYSCAHQLLFANDSQSIEVLCSYLESCGRFMLKMPNVSERVSKLLGILKRKRKNILHDQRLTMLIDNAYFRCLPPVGTGLTRKVKFRTPVEMYIRKLIYTDLSRSKCGFVLKKLLKLKWDKSGRSDSQNIRKTLINCFTKVWKLKHGHIYLMAKLLGSLSVYYPWFVTCVIDSVFEHIRSGAETNIFGHNQRRIAQIGYLCELFNYRLVSSENVFEVLHMLLSIGHLDPRPYPGRSCSIDLPNDFFRIRLSCIILEQCGPLLESSREKQTLKKYLLYLQLYTYSKNQPLPMDVDFMIDNMFEVLNLTSMRVNSWIEAAAALDKHMSKDPRFALTPLSDQAENKPVSGMAKEPKEHVESTSISISDNKAEKDQDDSYSNNAGTADRAIKDISTSPTPSEKEQMAESSPEQPNNDEVEKLQGAIKEISIQQEIDEFDEEFNKIMMESLESRKLEKSSTLDISIPAHLRDKKSLLRAQTHSQRQSREYSLNSLDSEEPSAPQDTNIVPFTLLTGKKQKPQTMSIAMPANSKLALVTRARQEADQHEMHRLKQLVLKYDQMAVERDEEELKNKMARRGIKLTFENARKKKNAIAVRNNSSNNASQNNINVAQASRLPSEYNTG
ncbi:mRNA decay protein [Mycoemilia scoparia]|uniref:mRNA decay protein n=1 Tax=Mycoemilia scoparia TaxID=417184 RepID=A0A9W8A8V7_9FUNG|nr:mRNA decay protein [Mycoemilia scoparia]